MVHPFSPPLLTNHDAIVTSTFTAGQSVNDEVLPGAFRDVATTWCREAVLLEHAKQNHATARQGRVCGSHWAATVGGVPLDHREALIRFTKEGSLRETPENRSPRRGP